MNTTTTSSVRRRRLAVVPKTAASWPLAAFPFPVELRHNQTAILRPPQNHGWIARECISLQDVEVAEVARRSRDKIKLCGVDGSSKIAGRRVVFETPSFTNCRYGYDLFPVLLAERMRFHVAHILILRLGTGSSRCPAALASRTAASFLRAASLFPSRVRGIFALLQATRGLARPGLWRQALLVDMSTWRDDTGHVNYRPSHRWVKLSVRAPDAQPLSLQNSEGLL
jgi:hypothetical protein